jgi:hypothetical protein
VAAAVTAATGAEEASRNSEILNDFIFFSLLHVVLFFSLFVFHLRLIYNCIIVTFSILSVSFSFGDIQAISVLI